MPSSLGEVQRIIGLSLSKIQLGRNQRGGLPLHKNLLVATVLNKARDLYMQETMYMNYKMMTGQFAAAASAANHQGVGSQMMGLGGQHQSPYPSHAAYHYHAASNHTNDGACEEDLEPQAEANDADYDEDSESDVEDECDNTTSARVVTPNPVASMSPYHHSVMTSMQNTSSVIQASQIQQQAQASSQVSPLHQAGFLHHQQQQHQPPHPQSVSQVQQPHSSSSSSSNSNDEGFIDEPDCDCDARNFSTSESRVPFQYCYHCAPFHPSNGRGPTLVPSPCSASLPSSPSSVTATLSTTSSSAATASSTVTSSTVTSSDFEVSKPSSTLYDMDSQPCGSDESEHQEEVNSLRGTKRGRSQSLDASSTDEESEPESQAQDKRKRRESEEELSSPETSQDESGYQSDSSHHEMFHPAFRGATPVTTSSVTSPTTEGSGAAPGQTMEIDQITSLVSIFSFVQHNMAAAAAANNRTSTTTTTDSRKSEDEEDKKGEGGGGGHSPSSEDSDSESDTSSDSGHSSDDHEA